MLLKNCKIEPSSVGSVEDSSLCVDILRSEFFTIYLFFLLFHFLFPLLFHIFTFYFVFIPLFISSFFTVYLFSYSIFLFRLSFHFLFRLFITMFMFKEEDIILVRLTFSLAEQNLRKPNFKFIIYTTISKTNKKNPSFLLYTSRNPF